MVRTEKSGVTVMLVGRRVVVWDADANKIGQLTINSYAWPVRERKDSYGTFGII